MFYKPMSSYIMRPSLCFIKTWILQIRCGVVLSFILFKNNLYKFQLSYPLIWTKLLIIIRYRRLILLNDILANKNLMSYINYKNMVQNCYYLSCQTQYYNFIYITWKHVLGDKFSLVQLLFVIVHIWLH